MGIAGDTRRLHTAHMTPPPALALAPTLAPTPAPTLALALALALAPALAPTLALALALALALTLALALALALTRLVVVGLASEDGDGSVDLLGEHQAREPMWERHRRQREPKVRLLRELLRQAVRAADQEHHRLNRLVFYALDPLCELAAAQRFAIDLEGDNA